MPEASPNALRRKAERVGACLVHQWWVLFPFGKYPDIAPLMKRLEDLFYQVDSNWLIKLEGEEAPEEELGFGATQVATFAVNVGKYLARAGAPAVTAAALILSRNAAGQKEIADKIEKWEAEGRTGDPPVKGPDGKRIDPWYVAPLKLAILTAGGVAVLRKGIEEAAKKIPTMPEWVWPVGVVGGIGLLALAIYLWSD